MTNFSKADLFEALEPRVHLAVTAAIISNTVRDVDWLTVVRYSSPDGIDVSTLGDNDIRVSALAKGGDFPQGAFTGYGRLWQAPIPQQDGSVLAVYRIIARGVAWDFSDNGTYSAYIEPGQVRDSLGNAATPVLLGQYNLWFTNPRAELKSAAASGASWNIEVEYADDVALDMSSIGTGDIVAYGPNGLVIPAVVSYQPAPTAANRATVYYQVRMPSPSMDFRYNGTWNFVIPSGEIRDNQGRTTPTFGLASYWYGTTNPGVDLLSSTRTATTWEVSVRYVDDFALNSSTIGDGDLRLVGPGGYNVTATLVSRTIINSRNIIANYTFPARHGAWNWTHNGEYTVSVVSSQVFDWGGGRVITGQLERANHAFSAPAIAVTGQPARNGNEMTVNVQFSDDTSLASSWAPAGPELSLRNSLGNNIGSVQLSTFQQTTERLWTATYRISLIGLSPGVYTLRANAGSITDSLGNSNPSFTLLTFTI